MKYFHVNLVPYRTTTIQFFMLISDNFVQTFLMCDIAEILCTNFLQSICLSSFRIKMENNVNHDSLVIRLILFGIFTIYSGVNPIDLSIQGEYLFSPMLL